MSQKEFVNSTGFKVMAWVTMLSALLLVLGSFTYLQSEEPEPTDMSGLAGIIATQVKNDIALNTPTYPTAAEIAALIVVEVPDMPDTTPSIRDEKKTEAEQLATEELNDRDFKEYLAGYLNSNCDGTDIDRHDITDVDVRDKEYSGFSSFIGDSTGTIEFELKVYYNNFGDDDEQETARVTVEFDVEGLDFDDDFEDAEVVKYLITSFRSCTTD